MSAPPARAFRSALVAAALLVATASLSARAVDEIDDLLEDLESDSSESEEQLSDVPDSGSRRRWDLGGDIAFGAAYNYRRHRSTEGTEYGGLSRLRLELELHADLDLPGGWKARALGYGFHDFAYRARGRDDYSSGVLDRYESYADFRELWVQGEIFDSFDLKVGRQVVNWGRSETLRVLDVLNPLDLREPGLQDLEDLRLGVSMARLDYYLGDWGLTAIVIPEIRFGENPAFGSDFFPRIASPFPIALPESFFDPPERVPNDFSGNTEYAFKISGIFRGWDVAFHYARFFEDLPHLEYMASMGPLAVAPELEHARLWMAGAGGTTTHGSWLLKAEVARLDGLEFTDIVTNPPSSVTAKKSRLDAMLGIEYFGFADVAIAFDVVNRYVSNFEPFMREPPIETRRNTVESALRISADFMRSRLHVVALGVAFGYRAQHGSFFRLTADYDLSDEISAGAGIMLYQTGDIPFFDTFGKNDRVFVRVRYGF